VADHFAAKGTSYTATGKLTIRNVTRDVPIAFTFEKKDGSAWLKCSAQIKRMDFGVFQGDWKDTEQVGNDVKVNFTLLLKP
jgi:polyisoprenoid-binding protein YceI